MTLVAAHWGVELLTITWITASTFNFRVSFSNENKSCTRRCSKLYVKFSDFRRENIAFMFSTLYEHTRCLGLRPEPFAPYRILCQKSRGLPRSWSICQNMNVFTKYHTPRLVTIYFWNPDNHQLLRKYFFWKWKIFGGIMFLHSR